MQDRLFSFIIEPNLWYVVIFASVFVSSILMVKQRKLAFVSFIFFHLVLFKLWIFGAYVAVGSVVIMSYSSRPPSCLLEFGFPILVIPLAWLVIMTISLYLFVKADKNFRIKILIATLFSGVLCATMFTYIMNIPDFNYCTSMY